MGRYEILGPADSNEPQNGRYEIIEPYSPSYEEEQNSDQGLLDVFANQLRGSVNRISNPDETKGARGITRDIQRSGNEFFGDIGEFFSNPELRGKLYQNIGSEIGGAASMPFEDPIRALQNLGQGGINAIQAAYNLGPRTHNYLKEKEVFDRPDAPVWENIDVGELTGRGPKKPGDALLSAMIEYMIPAKAGITKIPMAGGFVPKSAQLPVAFAAHEAGKGEDPVKAALSTLIGEGIFQGISHAPKALGTLKKAGEGAINKVSEGNKIAKMAKNPELLVNEIIKDKRLNKNISSNTFENIKKRASSSDVLPIENLNIKSDIIHKGDRKELALALKNFDSTKNIQDAIEANSGLKSLIRELDSKEKRGIALSNKESNALKEAYSTQKKIQDSIVKALESSKDPALANDYLSALKWHRENVIPYEATAINKFEAKRKTAKNLVKSLKSTTNDEFRIAKGELYPALEYDPKFFKALKYVLKNAAQGAGMGAGLDILGILK